MFMKNFLSTNTCLVLVTIQRIRKFLDEINKKVIGQMKESEGKIIGEFVGLDSKMYSMKNINLEHTKSTKYHYHVLMIKDLFQMMRFIH